MKTKLIKKQEAAEMLGVSVRSLERMIARGALPAYKVGARLVRLRAEEVEAYLDKHRAAPQREKPQPERPCRYVQGMRVI